MCRAAGEHDDETMTTEMVQADIELERAAAHDADDRGLADMLDLEKLANTARSMSRREALACRKMAEFCEGRGTSILDERTVVMTTDREGGTIEADADATAQKWLSLAKDYRMAVQKAIDTQAKLLKANMPAAAARYRAKQTRAIAELKSKGRAH